MDQLFTPKHNTIFRGVIVGGLMSLVIVLMVADLWQDSSYETGVGMEVPQPVPFSHKHHVGALGMDCRYCHMSAETSSFAGMPTTETCMKCHREIRTSD